VPASPGLIDEKHPAAMLRIKALPRLCCCGLSIGGVEERELAGPS
jgi:hypothetical protein